MIAACPTCGARYRIDPAKLGAEGARLRCSRCENVFRVRPPEAGAPAADVRAPAPATAARPTAAAPPRPAEAPAPRAPAAAPVRAPAPQDAGRAASTTSVAAAGPGAHDEAAVATPPADRSRLVLLAHPEVDAGKQIGDALSRWGLRVIVVHDGVEAILNIQRALPRVVVLDAALAKMFGFQVCELMKRNESLRSIQVVLVGAIHDQDRYRRPPGELYGADAYVERQTLPDALRPLLERFGVPLDAEPAAAAPAPRAAHASAPASAPPAARTPQPAPAPPAARAPQPAPAPKPVAEAPRARSAPAVATPASGAPAPASAAAPKDRALAQEQAQADRLARIIVSDIVLYNPEKFEEGLRSGRLVEALEAELAEGRTLFAQRIDPRVGSAEQFLERELMRVARTRTGR